MTIKKQALLALPPLLLLAVGAYFAIQLIAASLWSAQAKPLPAITVEAMYPGANASTIADTVAAPIEQHVNGVEQMVAMRSRCGNDGSYSLIVTFQRDADLNMAQVLVQNRVQLALPALPQAVQQKGISVKEKSPGFQLVVNLYSLDERGDSMIQLNYASLQLKDELARLAGVSDVVVVGEFEHRIGIDLDLKQLATHKITVHDVVRCVEAQNIQVAGTIAGGHRPIGPQTLRFRDADQAKRIILKVDVDRRIIYLKDVARLDAGIVERSSARFNGQPVASLFVYPLPHARLGEVRFAIEECLERLQKRLPKGLSLDVAFDFTPNIDQSPNSDHLWIDLSLPVGATRERTREVLSRSSKILRTMGAVWKVLELSGPPFAPFDEQGCMLVRLTPADRNEAGRVEIIQSIRDRLTKGIPEATIRLRDLSGTGRLPPGDYPIKLAIHGPEQDKVRDFAAKLVHRLRQSPRLTDVCLNAESLLTPQLFVEIDRDRALQRGVTLDEISKTLAICFGTPPIEGFELIDMRCSTGIRGGEKIPPRGVDVKKVKVRNDAGELFTLDDMVKVREVPSPRVINRLDLLPMEEITANPTPGVSLAEARSLCARLAETVRQELRLSPKYRVSWP